MSRRREPVPVRRIEPARCEHGHSCYDVSTFDAEGITACCGAYYSVFSDDGSLYCKCCYGSVGPDEQTPEPVLYGVTLD